MSTDPDSGAAGPAVAVSGRSQLQAQALHAFRAASGLTHTSARDCLARNGFDLRRAVDDFKALRSEGKLTPNYFQAFYESTVPRLMQITGLTPKAAADCLGCNGFDVERSAADTRRLQARGELGPGGA